MPDWRQRPEWFYRRMASWVVRGCCGIGCLSQGGAQGPGVSAGPGGPLVQPQKWSLVCIRECGSASEAEFALGDSSS